MVLNLLGPKEIAEGPVSCFGNNQRFGSKDIVVSLSLYFGNPLFLGTKDIVVSPLLCLIVLRPFRAEGIEG